MTEERNLFGETGLRSALAPHYLNSGFSIPQKCEGVRVSPMSLCLVSSSTQCLPCAPLAFHSAPCSDPRCMNLIGDILVLSLRAGFCQSD